MLFNFRFDGFARKQSSVCGGQFYNYEIVRSSRSNRSHQAKFLKSSYWNGTRTARCCEQTSDNDTSARSASGLIAEPVQSARQLRQGDWGCSTDIISKDWAPTFNVSISQDPHGILPWTLCTTRRIYRIDTNQFYLTSTWYWRQR